MESVATEILSLLTLAGLSPSDVATFPLRRVVGSRSDSGAINLRVANGECLVITFIEGFNLDMSAGPTMAVSSNPSTVGYPARPLETVFEVPTMYVFSPGTATFTFVVTAVPSNTAEMRVSGFILPGKALDILARLSIKEVVTP